MSNIGTGIVNGAKKVGNGLATTAKVGVGTAAVGTVAAVGYGASQLAD